MFGRFEVSTWNPRSSSPRGVIRSTWTSNNGGSRPRLAEVPQRSQSCAACSGRFSDDGAGVGEVEFGQQAPDLGLLGEARLGQGGDLAGG